SLANIFLANRIVSIEAKMSNWRKAIFQAVNNLWFASDSYVLIPDLKNSGNIASYAKDYGIGVIKFDGEKSVELLAPVSNKIPASYGSWIFNEMAVRHIFR